MPYIKDTLVARRGYGDTAADVPWWQKLAGGLITGYQGVQGGQLTQAQLDTQKAIAAQQGFGMTDVLLLGGAATAAYLLLKKKK